MAAGEAAVSRAVRIVGKVAKHYWPALATLAAALGGISYLAIADLSGAGRVWTEIGSVAGSLGISARGIGSAVAKLSAEGMRPVFALEEQDVIAWSVTELPRARLTHGAVAAVRRSGVPRGPRMGPIANFRSSGS